MLFIPLNPKDMSRIDESGYGYSNAYAVIQRVPLEEGSETNPDPNGKPHTLLNLLCAAAGSPLKLLAKALVRRH